MPKASGRKPQAKRGNLGSVRPQKSPQRTSAATFSSWIAGPGRSPAEIT